MENKPNYYGIIPANVRYDKRLTPNAKLLYSEITALCNDKGYCWANNKYFADLYEVSTTSISKWISSLIEFGYLTSTINYKEGTKEILHRYLRLVTYPIEEKLNTPIEEKLKDNNTINNNTINNNINFDKLLSFLNSKTGRNFKIINETTKKKYYARLKEGYKKDDILNAIINAVNSDYHKENGFKYLTPEFFSRADKLNMYSSINNKPNENNVNKSLIPKGVSFSGPQY